MKEKRKTNKTNQWRKRVAGEMREGANDQFTYKLGWKEWTNDYDQKVRMIERRKWE